MTGPFTAASHHDILVLLVQLSVLLLVARLLGELAQRLNQPSVAGEILAGILLGPSLLSGFFPAIGEWLVPQTPTQGYLLEVISMLGMMFLLLVTGLETDIPLIRRQARAAVGVAAGGLILPLALGFALGQFLPDDLLVDPSQRFVFSLFLATAMAISAIPVVAKVLMDLNLTRRDMGQTIIAAAMIDDTTGWVILSVVIGLAGGAAVTAGSVFQSVFSVAAFMFLSFTAGRWVVGRIVAFTQNRLQIRDKMLSLVVLLMFVWGAISQAIELEALLGAFVIGIVFSQTSALSAEVLHKLESIALGIFAPIFFAVAGLKVNALSLLEPRLIAITLIVIVVATVCKIVGVYAGARLIGRSDHWTALFYGAGLNARGSMGIIVATIGLSLGVLTQDMFSIFIVMAVVTSVMAPALLRWTLTHIKPSAAEEARLQREAINQRSLIPNIRRILMPVRVRPNSSPTQLLEAQILERLRTHNALSLTLMTIAPAEKRTESLAFLEKLSALFPAQDVVKKVLNGAKPADIILDEANKEYDLVVLGASEERATSEVLFTPLVDNVMRLAPCPTLLVQGERLKANWAPNRILVPTNGSLASRRAAELAFALAGDSKSTVTLLQVVEENRSPLYSDASGDLLKRQINIAEVNLAALRELALMQDVQATTNVKIAEAPETVILDQANGETDLIILGTNVSLGSDRLYLGPRVERILRNAPCPVIIFNSPL